MADGNGANEQIAGVAADAAECQRVSWHRFRPAPTAHGPLRRGSYTSRLVVATRLASALVFLVFGVGKFTNHGSELASFQTYGLPAPDAFVYVVGVVEVAGGVLLAISLAVTPAALALASDMIGAIVVSGIGRGETVSLTLAPALLVAMIFLLLVGTCKRRAGPLRRHRA
jgi:putative oxidoreductase